MAGAVRKTIRAPVHHHGTRRVARPPEAEPEPEEQACERTAGYLCKGITARRRQDGPSARAVPRRVSVHRRADPRFGLPATGTMKEAYAITTCKDLGGSVTPL